MNKKEVLVTQELGVVNFNFEEMKEYLNQRVDEYRNAVFTDESIKFAKSCVAQLRKEQTAFKSRITETKKEFMKPFDEFKKKADELVSLYDEPINFINGQVEDYERRRKAEKKAKIESLYEELVTDLKEYIPIEKIYNPKWENATYKMTDINKEIVEVAASVKEAIVTIEGMDSEAVTKALELYKKDLSLTNAISYINNYERQKAEILLREREKRNQEEIEKARAEERARMAEESRQKEAIEEAKEQAKAEVIESMAIMPEEQTKDYIYSISLGEESKKALEMYLDSIGVDWEILG